MSNVATCSYCKQEKPKSEFYKDSTRKGGVARCCKECLAQYMRNYRKTEKYKEGNRRIQAQFIQAHPERTKIYKQAQQVELDKECVRCKRSDVRLIRHHPDYSKPKDVVTLCDKCHRAVHKEVNV